MIAEEIQVTAGIRDRAGVPDLGDRDAALEGEQAGGKSGQAGPDDGQLAAVVAFGSDQDFPPLVSPSCPGSR